MSLSITFVAIFYSLMAALGWALATYWGGFDAVHWGGADEVTRLMQVGVGVSVGVVTVLLSQALEHVAEWARRLSEGFKEMLGQQSLASITAIAFFSGIGEEVFFRGFLQQMLAVHALGSLGAWAPWAAIGITSLGFGLLHIGPDRDVFWPWTVMATLMGVDFGVMFLTTGTLLAPILVHFTINFFNLMALIGED